MNVIGIGNAIVDVICKVDEQFLVKNHLTKSNGLRQKETQRRDCKGNMGELDCRLRR